jgi:hypothetical protein
MKMKVLLSIGFTLCGLLLVLSGCGNPSISTPTAPYNELDVYDINVQVHTIPQVDMNQSFKVIVTISSLYPIASLTGVFTDPSHRGLSGTLEELLRPPASYRSKKYGLCIDVAFAPDDPTMFTVDEKTTPTIQELPLVPDMSQVQISSPKRLMVTWNVMALDPGVDQASENIGADIAFTSEPACGDNQVPLLGTSYHLVKSAYNVVKSTTIQVINPELTREKGLVDILKWVALTAIPLLLAAFFAWIFGLFPGKGKQVDNAPQEGVQNPAPPASRKVAGWPIGCSIIGIVIGSLVLVDGLLFIWLGPPTIVALSTYVIVACVGCIIITVAALLIRRPKWLLPKS